MSDMPHTGRLAGRALHGDRTARPRRVAVVTGSFGAGHDAAAREIARRFHDDGYEVQVHDVVDFFPWRTGPLLRAAYLWQVRSLAWSWGLMLAVQRDPVRMRRRVLRLLGPVSPGLVGAVRKADLVVSTHPFASQVLGEARATGVLRARAATYLTDASVHPLWVHPGIDVHLAWHAVAAAQAQGHGATTALVEPLVPHLSASRRGSHELPDLRAGLGCHPSLPLALVVGGSHGVGALEATARDLLVTGLAQPVVLCGHNEDLRSRLCRLPGVVALGWRDDVARLMSVADVVVQNAGGFTTLEALAARVPVISYRCLPGHGRTNAAALQEAGLVPWALDVGGLGRLLQHALTPGFLTPTSLRRDDIVEVLAGPRVSAPTRLLPAALAAPA